MHAVTVRVPLVDGQDRQAVPQQVQTEIGMSAHFKFPIRFVSLTDLFLFYPRYPSGPRKDAQFQPDSLPGLHRSSYKPGMS